jgi:transposase
MNKSKSKTTTRYTAEFRRQMVELVRAGRKPRQLSRGFGCTAWSIQRWFN